MGMYSGLPLAWTTGLRGGIESKLCADDSAAKRAQIPQLMNKKDFFKVVFPSRTLWDRQERTPVNHP
jgi:hypothetical protein